MNKKKVTLADSVEYKLLEYLRLNHLHFGDHLPGEIYLSERLQISRHIVREGISRLKALGILESKTRCGTVFCRPAPFYAFQKLAEAKLFTEDDQANFMQIRIALELGMCDFIYSKRTPDKIKALRKIAGDSNETTLSISAEVDFHSALMAFAENSAANDFRKVLILAFGSMSKKVLTDITTPPHIAICDVLEKGSFADFQSVMRQHFTLYLNYV